MLGRLRLGETDSSLTENQSDRVESALCAEGNFSGEVISAGLGACFITLFQYNVEHVMLTGNPIVRNKRHLNGIYLINVLFSG